MGRRATWSFGDALRSAGPPPAGPRAPAVETTSAAGRDPRAPVSGILLPGPGCPRRPPLAAGCWWKQGAWRRSASASACRKTRDRPAQPASGQEITTWWNRASRRPSRTSGTIARWNGVPGGRRHAALPAMRADEQRSRNRSPCSPATSRAMSQNSAASAGPGCGFHSRRAWGAAGPALPPPLDHPASCRTPRQPAGAPRTILRWRRRAACSRNGDAARRSG